MVGLREKVKRKRVELSSQLKQSRKRLALSKATKQTVSKAVTRGNQLGRAFESSNLLIRSDRVRARKPKKRIKPRKTGQIITIVLSRQASSSARERKLLIKKGKKTKRRIKRRATLVKKNLFDFI